MLLKQKITLILATIVLLMVALNAAVLLPVSDSFSDLERAQAQRNSGRVEQALSNYSSHLARTAMDWSHWDESYRFVAGEEPDFVAENMAFATFANLGVNVIYFYNRAGEIVWGKTYDLATEEETTLAHFAPGTLASDDALLRNTERRTNAQGFIVTEAGPLLVASSPMLPTGGEGEARGTVVFGRLLDPALIDEMREQTNVDFDILWDGSATGSAPAVGAGSGFAVEETLADVLVGIQPVADLYGQPTVEIRTRTPRDITRVGERSISISLASLAVVGLVAVVVVWVLLQRLVLRPLTGLTAHIVEIGATGAMDRRVPARGGDECSMLAREFNRMLDRLADARRQLVEQSHRSGMAEMAAGVLHNLRNSLTPLVGRLEGLTDRMRNAPGGQILRAAAEIEDPATDEARRHKLIQYVCTSGQSLVQLNAATADELGQAMDQARTLGEILRFQDKFIYSSSAVEPVGVGDAVKDAIRLMQPRLPNGIGLEVDPGIDALPPVAAERITLVQVVHNLLVNGVEAIQRSGRPDGRITLWAGPSTATEGMVDLAVADNGVGIAAADLDRIFERGFTTKKSGSGGLGLHWSANAVGNMQGRLHVESEPNGGRTVLHVLLPAIEQRQAAA